MVTEKKFAEGGDIGGIDYEDYNLKLKLLKRFQLSQIRSVENMEVRQEGEWKKQRKI